MAKFRTLLRAVALSAVVVAGSARAAACAPSQQIAEVTAALTHGLIAVNGVKLYYVEAGTGDPVVLVPGWPESWYAWRRMIPILAAAGHRVLALDPRGFGDSDKPIAGYDPDTSARDLHGFIGALGLGRDGGIDIVAHDVGTWIAHAHASMYPQDVRRLVLSEAALPGVTPPPSTVPSDALNVKIWQFGFNRLDDLPEILVRGHERDLLAWLFAHKTLRPWAIDAAAVDEYARILAAPGGARAGFAYYEGYLGDAGIEQVQALSARQLPMPILAVGAEAGVGNALLNTMKRRDDDVRGAVLAGCGHYLPEECPDAFAAAILAFWKSTDAREQAKR